jgi:membrane protein implicated in regulation of membrane protease activity
MLTYMRRLVNFIVCIGLICAGAYFVYGEVFVRFSGRSKLLVVGLVFIASGVVWLWYEFVGPVVIRRMIEKRDTAAKAKGGLPR